MQFVNNIPSDYQLTSYFVKYYELYSVKSLPTRLCVDSRLRRVLDMVHDKAGLPRLIGTNAVAQIDRMRMAEKQSKKVFVAFSGGKDCLATAIRAYQDGYAPVLVYVGGVNKSLPSEKKHAEQIAHAAGFPLIKLSINISGNKEYNEHPLKNLLILCLLVDTGLKYGATTFALGDTFDDDTAYGSLDYDLSDSQDMLRAFGFFITRYIPGFKLLHYMCNTLQSFYTIVKYDKRIIPLLSTCIIPDYRKPMLRKANVKKYGEDILGSGCGGCYKCADEYLFKLKFGLVRSSIEYTKKCMQAKIQFDRNYRANFKFDTQKYNRFGGHNNTSVQVLCDRCGYYIGDLTFDDEFCKYFTNRAYGSKHYKTRQAAEAVCTRFKRIYKL